MNYLNRRVGTKGELMFLATITTYPYDAKIRIVLIALLNLIIQISVTAIDDIFYQNLSIGQEYYIYNEGYPNKYVSGYSQKWVLETRDDAEIVLNCELELPPSILCLGDKLSVSKTGSTSFLLANSYCGTDKINAVSEENQMAIGLFASLFSIGGTFFCNATAIQSMNTTECDCGRKREVGSVNEFPFVAKLIDLRTGNLTCGATIIANKYALTAARCISNENFENYALLTGEYRNGSASAGFYLLADFIVHPDYNNNTNENDIAVIIIDGKNRFGEDVGPVCFPSPSTNYDLIGETLTALGWCTTTLNGSASIELQKVNLTVESNDVSAQQLQDVQIFINYLCTRRNKEGGRCTAFPNDPYRQLMNLPVILMGTTSTGGGPTSDSPGPIIRAYMSIGYYMDWIESTTPGKEEYQEKSPSSVNLDEITIIFLPEENHSLQIEIAELENLGINLPEENRNQFLDSNFSSEIKVQIHYDDNINTRINETDTDQGFNSNRAKIIGDTENDENMVVREYSSLALEEYTPNNEEANLSGSEMSDNSLYPDFVNSSEISSSENKENDIVEGEIEEHTDKQNKDTVEFLTPKFMKNRAENRTTSDGEGSEQGDTANIPDTQSAMKDMENVKQTAPDGGDDAEKIALDRIGDLKSVILNRRLTQNSKLNKQDTQELLQRVVAIKEYVI
ncbi:hypothetical protein FQA39_LY11676 [Lamprigera yunnana]|nr:hypothetical protein FQA39_LY11676 [Lamprigera yunnana]